MWYIFRVWQGPPAVLCEDRRAAPVSGALQRKCECLYFFIIFKIYNYYLNFIKVTDINFKYFHCLSYMSQLSRRGHVTSKHRIIIIPDICPVSLDKNPSQYNLNPDTFPCVRQQCPACLVMLSPAWKCHKEVTGLVVSQNFVWIDIIILFQSSFGFIKIEFL